MLRVLALALVLNGCMQPPGDPDKGTAAMNSSGETSGNSAAGSGAGNDTSCVPPVFLRLVGRPDSALHVLDLPENVRVIEPGMAVTQDYRADRVNIEINQARVIARVWCG